MLVLSAGAGALVSGSLTYYKTNSPQTTLIAAIAGGVFLSSLTILSSYYGPFISFSLAGALIGGSKAYIEGASLKEKIQKIAVWAIGAAFVFATGSFLMSFTKL